MEKKHITGIVLAGGSGSRMQSGQPKQFMELNGKPMMFYSLYALERSAVDDVILVSRQEDIPYCQTEIVEQYQLKKVKMIISGGAERYLSVKNALKHAEGADYVLIHDAARPCLTQEIIVRSIEQVAVYDACTVGVPVKDTIKIVDEDNMGIDTPPRDRLWQIQTPQSFLYHSLVEAYNIMEEKGDTDVTDDTMIYERYLGRKSKVIQGDYRNIKVTTPEDFQVVENFLKKIEKSC